ncbi:Cation/H+ exchanger domain-containing protein [Madurella fahalii]|uniref:Cation/H+ exchanger domain-containing protein n=1 Tax=Madurella fahalii TaxID=1157608 RepID=A0ABQ0GGC6_9PEZI
MSASSVSSFPSTTMSAAPTSTSGNRAPSQGGVIEGANPSEYNPKDPITIFIIQAGLIIVVCHLLHWPLSKIRQPRVIAEVVGGILLGPSVMGRIPGFRAAIFPTESLPNLTLVANIGLVLYLFLIGLETDVRFLVSNWRVATSVALAGMALPFGLGCALAWGLYHQFSGDEGIVSIGFSVYMLFIGVAIAITAFPVLCRILTELKLLDTSVGVITLSAGVANDVVGWILLALCVALVNAGSGLTALWILMTCVAFMLFLLYAVKPSLVWLLRRTGSLKTGPSQTMISVILLLAFASAFFTGIVGVHAIFGGFMVGLILPREGGFNIKVTEKLEDLIGAVFLPLYFTLSGLNTNLGLLDSGMAWGYVVAVTLVAFFTKLFGASLAARLNGLVWRESFAIGVLMSCKGLVELIVLNIGLQARILSTRTFTIFVVMALLTTFITTPLTTLLYPPWYQKKLEAWKRGEIDWVTGAALPNGANSDGVAKQTKPSTDRIRRLLVSLTLDHMPAILDLVSLFATQSPPESHHAKHNTYPGPTSTDSKEVVRAHGIHLLQLTDRDSSVMTVSQVDEYSRYDPVVNIFRALGRLHRIAVSGEVAVMPDTRFAEALISKASAISSDLLLVPWSEAPHNLGGAQAILSETTADKKFTSSYANFIKSIIQSGTDQNMAIFFSNDPGAANLPDNQNLEGPKLTRAYSFRDVQHDIPAIPTKNKLQHIFLPYFGGKDDNLALVLVLQLCEKAEVTATVVHFSTSGPGGSTSGAAQDAEFFTFASTHYSRTEKIASRVQFETAPSSNGQSAFEAVLERAVTEIQPESRDTTWNNLVVLGRNINLSLAVGDKTSHITTKEVKECLGLVAENLIASGLKSDLLVVQAKASMATPN